MKNKTSAEAEEIKNIGAYVMELQRIIGFMCEVIGAQGGPAADDLAGKLKHQMAQGSLNPKITNLYLSSLQALQTGSDNLHTVPKR